MWVTYKAVPYRRIFANFSTKVTLAESSIKAGNLELNDIVREY